MGEMMDEAKDEAEIKSIKIPIPQIAKDLDQPPLPQSKILKDELAELNAMAEDINSMVDEQAMHLDEIESKMEENDYEEEEEEEASFIGMDEDDVEMDLMKDENAESDDEFTTDSDEGSVATVAKPQQKE